MNRYLLLILLTSWAHVVPLSWQCETAVAFPGHVLSIYRSNLANADVALLKTYTAEDVNKCLKDCCTELYGSCSVASFKKDSTEVNCQHFNCRPVQKCKFLSSNSTDSFSFSSSPSPQVLVPSSHASKNDSLSATTTSVTDKPKLDTTAHSHQASAKETLATYSEEQLALKNDNTSVKPRKGVSENPSDLYENAERSSIKPRKGVSFEGVTVSDNAKSKVKPRKGVGPYQSESEFLSSALGEPSIYEVLSTESMEPSKPLSATETFKNVVADDLVSALEKVFEDDTGGRDTKISVTSSNKFTAANTETASIKSSTTYIHSVIPTTTFNTHYSTSSVIESTILGLQPSLPTTFVATSSIRTPNLQTHFIQATEVVSHIPTLSSSPTILEHSKLLFHEITADQEAKLEESLQSKISQESENERKYKSSMHLVLSLVFGLLVLFSVLGVVAKRVYDSWMRRHYRRMDFLIDGMYNGYG